MITKINRIQILTSALLAEVIPDSESLISALATQPEAIAIAQIFGDARLIRKLNLARSSVNTNISLDLEFQGTQVSYLGNQIGNIKILFKSPLPGELQARLAVESAIDRFLEYLQKIHKITVLEESDRHVKVFIPDRQNSNFAKLWKNFIEQVAFAEYGLIKYKLPGLVQTFISMLNSVTLSGRGFSTLDVPILNRGQANVIAAWYLAVVREVKQRQDKRQHGIDELEKELEKSELTDKERKSKSKEIKDKQSMQKKERDKYRTYFQKSFKKSLDLHREIYQDILDLDVTLSASNCKVSETKKIRNQKAKLESKLTFSNLSVEQKLDLWQQCQGDPFQFIQLDRQQNPDKFKQIELIAKNFTKIATDQINSTRGDIFTQCISEMYQLLEMSPDQFESIPPPLLTEKPILPMMRSPGDDSKEFCYSCGTALNPKTAKWQVLRFMFERPSQRRQSSSGEGRPHICASCSALAFASPLKVTDQSIILRIDPADHHPESQLKIKEYLRMLVNKEMHISAGRYILLASDKTKGGDSAAQKLGQVQYALAKVASMFPVEVLSDFKFSLIAQGSEAIVLENRHLIFIRGLMTCYGQSIVTAGKEINMTLGDAIRYVQQDLPYLADYTITKIANIFQAVSLEKFRCLYGETIQKDVNLKGESMNSDTPLPKRARLYRDVAALTGLTFAFANSLESTAKKSMDKNDVEREVSKLIEKVDDATAFCYYATLGVDTSVQARLWHNPDNYFIYEATQNLLSELGQVDREHYDAGKQWLQLYVDDITRAYAHFAEKKDYAQEKDWKELTYQLQLSLYTRFPELVRKLKKQGGK